MQNPANNRESVRLEMLCEGEIVRMPGTGLNKIHISDKWQKADDNLVDAEKMWNNKRYYDDAGDSGGLRHGKDDGTFCEIATEKTGLYRLMAFDDYDSSMNPGEPGVISGAGDLYFWARFYGRMEIHGVIYGGTKTVVTITHMQKIYFRKVV